MKSLFRLASGVAFASLVSGSVMAQDASEDVCSMNLGDSAICNELASLEANLEISTDEGFTPDLYCIPTALTTPTASAFFNRIGCGEGAEDEFEVGDALDGILAAAPKADAEDVPTIESYFNGNALAKCVYDSFPGGAKFEKMPDGRVQTGDFVILETDVSTLKRIATYECRALNMP